MLDITQLHIAHHRNGVTGVPFHVVTFQWKDGTQVRHMVATVFEMPGACAVLDINLTAKDQLAFGEGNSWRGDTFEKELRIAITMWERNRMETPLTITVTPQHLKGEWKLVQEFSRASGDLLTVSIMTTEEAQRLPAETALSDFVVKTLGNVLVREASGCFAGGKTKAKLTFRLNGRVLRVE